MRNPDYIVCTRHLPTYVICFGTKNASAVLSMVAQAPCNSALGSKLGAFSQLYINFEHEKRCIKKCFMMEGKKKQVIKSCVPRHRTLSFIKKSKYFFFL